MILFFSTLLLAEAMWSSAEENVALGKPTNMTRDTILDVSKGAARAVDGSVATCSWTVYSETVRPEWWVHLLDIYAINNITVHNSNAKSEARHFLYFTVGILDGVNEEVICGNQTTVLELGQAVTYTCPPARSLGRYVHIRHYASNHIPLCEVEVSGELVTICPAGYYGIPDCDQTCGQCLTQPCGLYGLCHGGCKLWWTGDTCHTEIVGIHYSAQDSSASGVSVSSIRLEWEQISVPAGLEHFYSYTVTYISSSHNNSVHVPQTSHLRQQRTLGQLDVNTVYDIIITPYWTMGRVTRQGLSYPRLSAKTLCGDPGAAEIESVINLGESLKVIFTVPQSNCDFIQNVTVQYKQHTSMTWEQYTASVTETDTSVTVPVDPGYYVVRLEVTNNAGLQSYSPTARSVVQGGEPQLYGCSPGFGPMSGGTVITITGEHLEAGVRAVYLGSYLQLHVMSGTSTSILARTPNMTENYRDSSLAVTLELLSGRNKSAPCTFTVRGDPEIDVIEPLSTIRNGGTNLTVTGRSMDSVAYPLLLVTADVTYVQSRNTSRSQHRQLCHVVSISVVLCRVPDMDLPGEDADPHNISLYLGFILDGVPDYRDLRENARLKKYSQMVINLSPGFSEERHTEFNFKPNSPLVIEGTNIQNVRLSDYQVRVGLEECPLTSYTANSLHCVPPQANPQPDNSDNPPPVVIDVGSFISHNIGYLNYEAEFNVYLIAGCAAGGVLFLLVVIVLVVVCKKRRAKHHKPTNPLENAQGFSETRSDREIPLGPRPTVNTGEQRDYYNIMPHDYEN